LHLLTDLLRFDGSLIVFGFPELTRAFLAKAQMLGGDELLKKLRSHLYRVTGPAAREYKDGIRDKEQDYVESEALKAAEVFASDALLGPFYRWIVEMEQQDRFWHKAQSEAEMANLECDLS
jgi:hypothetical protein